MTAITYFKLKSKTYFKKVIITTNNTFTWFIGFININFFRHINSMKLQHLHITQQIYLFIYFVQIFF